MTLTPKQKQFAEEYVKTGLANEAYMTVYGCKERVAAANSSRTLTKANVREYIEALNKAILTPKIADMIEVKEFWTQTLRNEEIDRKDRLKASEYIAKTNAAFIEKIDHSGKIELPNITITK
jgi:phage terminase small subunit